MRPTAARAIDLGRVSPQRLHAAYQAIAESAAADAPPVLLYRHARARASVDRREPVCAAPRST